jgi:hypothetical protein
VLPAKGRVCVQVVVVWQCGSVGGHAACREEIQAKVAVQQLFSLASSVYGVCVAPHP